MPMSIFVLNLATLLGLGLGVDYSLLMTSRFREELAQARRAPDRVAEAVRVTVATAGRAVFFSGLTVLLGLLGPRPVRVHDPALGRASPARSSWGSRSPRRLTLLPAILAIVGTRIDALAVRRVTVAAGRRRAVGAARAPRHAPPGRRARARRCRCCSSSGSRSSTSGSTPRTRRSSPRRSRRARRTTSSPREFGEGEFAPLVLAVRTTGRRDDPGERRRALRVLAAPRGRPAGRPGWSSLVDVDPRLTLAQYQLLYGVAGRAAGPVRRDDPRRDDEGRPDGVHGLHAVRPEPRRRAGRWSASSATPAGPLAPPAGVSVLVGGGAADVDDVVSPRLVRLPAHRRCSSS